MFHFETDSDFDIIEAIETASKKVAAEASQTDDPNYEHAAYPPLSRMTERLNTHAAVRIKNRRKRLVRAN